MQNLTIRKGSQCTHAVVGLTQAELETAINALNYHIRTTDKIDFTTRKEENLISKFMDLQRAIREGAF